MIPDGTDISNLSAQLQQDHVAFSNPELADDPQLNQSIAAHLAEDHAIAVVDVFPQRPADSRDIAQELADATGISTVIVQTPVNVSAVSTKYSRAELEAAQTNLPNGIGQVELVDTFYHNMESANPFNVMIGAVVLLTLCIFGMSVTTFFQVMRNLARA